MTIVFDAIELMLSVWLVIAFMNHERWTRIAFMVFGCVFLPLYVWKCQDGDLILTRPYDLANTCVLLFYLVLAVWSLRSDMRLTLSKSSRMGVCYLISFALYFGSIYYYSSRRYGSDEWRTDALYAACLGSDTAKNELVDYVTQVEAKEDVQALEKVIDDARAMVVDVPCESKASSPGVKKVATVVTKKVTESKILEKGAKKMIKVLLLGVVFVIGVLWRRIQTHFGSKKEQ